MSQQLEGNLFSSVCNLTAAFSGIEQRKFLGQPSLAANGNLFVLVTRECRIALHLKGLDIDDRLNVPKASCLWKAGGHLMINWILVPEEFHFQEENLTDWLKLGYDYACARSLAGGGYSAANH